MMANIPQDQTVKDVKLLSKAESTVSTTKMLPHELLAVELLGPGFPVL